MKRNRHESFVGLQALKQVHEDQIRKFEKWASRGYCDFHHNHYDWWAFPIDEPSSKGFSYVVFDGDVEELKKDDRFMSNYLRGLQLICESWGWDLFNFRESSKKTIHQQWQDWPIRLWKAAYSSKLFGAHTEFESMKVYGKKLLGLGKEFRYGDKDLSNLFLETSPTMFPEVLDHPVPPPDNTGPADGRYRPHQTAAPSGCDSSMAVGGCGRNKEARSGICSKAVGGRNMAAGTTHLDEGKARRADKDLPSAHTARVMERGNMASPASKLSSPAATSHRAARVDVIGSLGSFLSALFLPPPRRLEAPAGRNQASPWCV